MPAHKSGSVDQLRALSGLELFIIHIPLEDVLRGNVICCYNNSYPTYMPWSVCGIVHTRVEDCMPQCLLHGFSMGIRIGLLDLQWRFLALHERVAAEQACEK